MAPEAATALAIPDNSPKLVQLLSQIGNDDLAELDNVIARQEESLARLKQFRKVAGVIFEPPPPPKKTGGRKKAVPPASSPGTPPTNGFAPSAVEPGETVAATEALETTSGSEREKKMLAIRKSIVIHIGRLGRAAKVYDLIVACKISARWVNEILNHEWFSQDKNGVLITSKARQEVLDT